jgi:NADH-quinone oxidoreductase subunit G
MENKTLFIDGCEISFDNERNLLEVIRKANIELPTFCYHSELSVYGACRLCMVDIEGRGLVASCSTPPEAGLKVKTSSQELRELRRISIELLLASHDYSCPTCQKNTNCKLQDLARKLGVTKVRFKPVKKTQPLDCSSPSLVRDPNKCILCGDCVRMCAEVQGIGAIDFAHRGHNVCVLPAFGRDLKSVECVYCGQCANVCPTGALTVKYETEDVWKAIENPAKKVVVQIAPAVRVALGEAFNLPAGTISIGQIVTALRILGFHKVYDTSFAADLTVIEETSEFIKRKQTGEKLPQFTSCCPAWVKYAEQFYPELLPNLSSCRSPQQMFGSLAKSILPAQLGIDVKDLVVVSIMPCTAKKFEAKRSEFAVGDMRDVDHVITTQELARMIEERGLDFNKLSPDSLDMPLGFKTGAGVIFGSSGGVSEAVLRYAYEKISGKKLDSCDFIETRGKDGIREIGVNIDGTHLKIAIVHSLGNARKIADSVKAGNCDYDFIEVMACPGGCIAGAGQPVSLDRGTKEKRCKGLYEADKMLQLHKSQDNPYIIDVYKNVLKEPNSEKAHKLLHTCYYNRRRIEGETLELGQSQGEKLAVNVCVGTSCYIRGSQKLLSQLINHLQNSNLSDKVDIKATFCFENCSKGPTIKIGDTIIHKCTVEKARQLIEEKLVKAKIG